MAKKNNEKENAVVNETNSKDNAELNKEEVKSATKATKKSSSKETTKKAKKKSGFFKDFKAELKKVVWPTPKEVANSTTAVIVIVLITTLLVFILDFGFEKIVVHGIDKATSIVSSKSEDNEAEVDVTEDVVVNTVLENTTDTTENNTTVE